MNAIRHLAPATLAGILLAGLACNAQAQFNLNIGAEPNCPYGFYDYAPYACAPSGYYGPEWFLNGSFIGAGPWFHGPDRFRGRVDNHFDGRHGYRGQLPAMGERHDPQMHAGRMAQFGANTSFARAGRRTRRASGRTGGS